MFWVALTAVGSFIAALGGIGLNIASRIQQSKESGAKESATIAQVGVDLIKEANARQEKYIIQLVGDIGRVEGQLAECKEERHLLMDENKELKRDNVTLKAQVGEARAEIQDLRERLEKAGL